MKLANSTVNFIERELENYRVNVRNGNLDPSNGFHPTIGSAIDSLMQAPRDVIWEWFQATNYEQLEDAFLNFLGLVLQEGLDAKLVDIVGG